MNIFVLGFRVHLISCMLLCALCSLCNEHKLNIKEDKIKSARVGTITGLDYWTGLQDSPKLQNTPRSVQDRS